MSALHPISFAGSAGSAVSRGVSRWRRRDPARNLLRALRKELRLSTAVDADRARRDAIFRQIKAQLVDPQFRSAFQNFSREGDPADLGTIRSHLDTWLDTDGLGAGRDEVVEEIITILARKIGGAQPEPLAAVDVQATQVREEIGTRVQGVSEQVAALAEQSDAILSAVGTGDRVEAELRLLTVDWAPAGAQEALTALGKGSPELLEKLQREVGDPVDRGRVSALIDGWPRWLAAGPEDLLKSVARLAEQHGDWSRSTRVWERAALTVEAGRRVDFYVRAAVAAGVAGDDDRRKWLLAEARDLDPAHPRLLLEEVPDAPTLEEQLALLDQLDTDDGELLALAALQRSVGHLIREEVSEARRAVEEARAHAPAMVQVRLCHLNVVVHDARIAVGRDRAYSAPELEAACREAGELRTELLQQGRFQESGRLLMLRMDSLLLLAESDSAGDLVGEVVEEELKVPMGAEILAEAAVRADRPEDALRFVTHATTDIPVAERIRHYATGLARHGSESAEAAAALEGMAQEEGPEAVKAAINRSMLAVDQPRLGWSEPAEGVLKKAGLAKVWVGGKAIFLAKQHDPRAAMELLEEHSDERWALEAMVRITKIWGNRKERARAAERLLARGPDQPMALECGQALASDEKFEQARQVLVGLAGDRSAARSIRGNAFMFSMLVVGRELGDWAQAAELLEQWRDVDPSDSRIPSWHVAVAANRPGR
jgi:hypothetical protein